MKSIIVTIVLILMTEGCRSNVKKVVNSTVPLRDFSTLPIPYPKYSKFEDKSSTISRLIVRWDPVEISEDNPILGFKTMAGYVETLLVVSLMTWVLVSEGCRTGVSKREMTMLPPPEPRYLEVSEQSILNVRWDPVTFSMDNPILGFRIKLWAEEKKDVYKYIEQSDGASITMELVPTNKTLRVLPTHKPAFEAVVPPDVLEARFILELGEEYEIRGQSFSAFEDGPLSAAVAIRILAPPQHEMSK